MVDAEKESERHERYQSLCPQAVLSNKILAGPARFPDSNNSPNAVPSNGNST